MLVQWFEELGLLGQVCLCFAVPATIVLVVQIVLSLIGLSDGGLDLPDGVDGGALDLPDGTDDLSPPDILDGFHIFTARTVVSFFAAFGWMGVSLVGTSLPSWAVALISVGFGILVMLFVAFLMLGIYRLQSDGTADNRNAVGAAGTVYLTVPAGRSGRGKVNVMLQGSYVEREAVTDEAEPLPYGTEVLVVGISGESTLVVVKK